MSEEVASHSDESQVSEKEAAVKDAFEAFGIEIEEETGESDEQQEEKAEEEAPAIEQKTEPKTIKVKHNKEEIEVDVSDDKLPEYVQKALALDKERERKSEYEKSLDRVAKLQGYKDHAELVANLDRIEHERAQAKEREFEELEKSFFDELVDVGLDEQKARDYIDKHPLLAEARALKTERAEAQQKEQAQTIQQQTRVKWDEFYSAYPELVESSQVFKEGRTPEWFTPEMQSRIERGYDPKDAYELAHKSTIMQQTAKKSEQKAIKDQMLGKRSQVETNTTPNNEPVVSPALATAFSMFGLNPSAAKKYVKK